MNSNKSIEKQKLEIEEALKKLDPDNSTAVELRKVYRDLEAKQGAETW